MMNLREKCEHCSAPEGVICTEDCSVNGKKVKRLIKSLADLSLWIDRKSPVDCNCCIVYSKTTHGVAFGDMVANAQKNQDRTLEHCLGLRGD